MSTIAEQPSSMPFSARTSRGSTTPNAVPLQLVPPSAVAEMLGIKVETLATWRYRGVGIPFVKLGRKVAYRLSDVMSHVEAATRRSTADEGPSGGG